MLARSPACLRVSVVLSTLAAGGLARSVDGRRGRTREFDDPRRRRRRRRHVPCYCTSAAAPVALVGFADSIIGPIVILSTQVCVFLFARIRFELAPLWSLLRAEVLPLNEDSDASHFLPLMSICRSDSESFHFISLSLEI